MKLTMSRASSSRMACAAAILIALTAGAGELRVEQLDDSLWRVRMSREGKWPESGLTRYGILKPYAVRESGSSLDALSVRPKVSQTEKGFALEFPLAPGERLYGLGDASRENLERRGGIYELWVENFKRYIPIPMMLSSRGWGVLLNTTWPTRWDVGKSDAEVMKVTAAEGEIDFYLFTGQGYPELLDAYTRLTGRPAMLPCFGYGFTYVANQWIDMFRLLEEARRFRDLGLPCDILGLEPGWMKYYYDTTTKKDWNDARFTFPSWSDSRAISWIGGLDRMGFRLSLWLCCNYDLFVFEEACARGEAKPLARKAQKTSDVSDGWTDSHVAGDFGDATRDSGELQKVAVTADQAMRYRKVMRPDGLSGEHESGREPWFEHLKKFVDRGVRAFKLDGCAQVRDFKGRAWGNGMKNDEAHNLYPLVYAKQMSEGYETYANRRAMVYSVSGYAGLQRYVATWAGDTGGGAKPLVSCLNLGVSGHPNQSCDMDLDSLERVHFAIFSPWSQQNNWDYFQQPWYRGDDALAAIRGYLRLRYRLFPYIYAAAAKAHRTGWPICCPLAFAYPEDPAFDDVRTSYLFGDSLLVSAFAKTVRLPQGDWYDYRTGERLRGGTDIPVRTDSRWGGGLFVKAGAIVPMWPEKSHLERGWNEEVELHVWPGADGESEWYEDDGDSLGYRKGECARIALRLRGAKLTISPRVGAFTGMPATHRVKVVVHEGATTRTVDLGTVNHATETTVELF